MKNSNQKKMNKIQAKVESDGLLIEITVQSAGCADNILSTLLKSLADCIRVCHTSPQHVYRPHVTRCQGHSCENDKSPRSKVCCEKAARKSFRNNPSHDDLMDLY